MRKFLGSAFFYARFARSFSAIGYRRRAANWPPFKPDFSGQTWLVSGATGGIGRAVVLSAVAHGATVLALARSPDKLSALKAEAADPQRLLPIKVDLASVGEVRDQLEQIAARGAKVDVLVNNVGVLLNQHQLSNEGLEASFATNLLNHYVLTTGLHQRGVLAEDGIVISVSSGGMYGTPLKLDCLDGSEAQSYDGMAAYAMHKRAQVELTRHWNDLWQGAPRVHVMHPGWADTDGVKRSLPGFRAVMRRILRNADQAADTILWLAEQRPPAAPDGGIWLDRELQPEHEFAFTRNSEHSADELAGFLQQRVNSVNG